ncbi:flagellar biosynthesis protein FlhB [Agaricicola taiwanensis]|uniref:Flagellar biosynthetic protein FlhB n=1 Tax=Agaricicola taiwanensis TaxID=591372 RepID=A0A8J2VNS2_9RHOB|nr:flagellar biosynthesis protein FlhB [Agaricicola taiwanensis]GGE40742.1 flagellar biosynthesis protein FlhB [Agaricicola taiwanensis]
MAEGGDDDAERTEEPSQKKLDDARKKGNIAKSQEINTWFMLLAGAMALSMFGANSSAAVVGSMRGILEHAHDIRLDGGSIMLFGQEVFYAVMGAIALPLALFMLAGLVGNIIQHPPLWTTEPLMPKFSKVSPIAGFGRIFSKQSLVTFLKGLVKIGIVGAILIAVVWPEQDRFALTVQMDVMALGPFILEETMKVLIATVAVFAVLAGADYVYQRQTWYNKLRMSVRELKEEYKQQEGDPHIKARIRQLRMERSRRRMMAAVPTATVVITNPTHFAVALKYENGMDAPVCVAKGLDAVALRIRSVAQENDVPTVENPPLARALYASVEIDDAIPDEHFRAVAEVIGYVYRLKGKTRKN